MQNGTFRRDIAALRAVAVAAVVLFHFGVPGFDGGFVGVDVFFVISGFLMTGIVSRAMARENFSLWGFYRARAERIIPALAVVCIALGVLSLIAVDPMTTREIGTQTLSALTFTSNILFWSQDSYFAAGADTKWLLHTWSLSVEWQFYLVFPIVVMLIWRVPFLRARFGWVMIAGTVLSFVACAVFAGLGPTELKTTFFMLPFRAWEMLLGGVIVCYPALFSRLPAPLVALTGLGMIVASIFVFGPSTPWPAGNAALPTLGTALVLWAGGRWEGWANLPGVQRIGAWSYSIYLWHWPVVVALHLTGQGGKPLPIVLGMAASVVLGALSYALVETRMRQWWLGGSARVAVTAAVLGLGAPLALSTITGSTNGLERFRIASMSAETRAALLDYRAASSDFYSAKDCTGGAFEQGELQGCRIGEPAARDTLIIGDSHARQLGPRLAAQFANHPGGATLITRGGCPALPQVKLKNPGDACDVRNRQAFDFAATQPFRHVVIASFWSGYLEPDGDGGSFQHNFCFVEGDACASPVSDAAYLTRVDAAVDALGRELARLKQAGKEATLVLAVPYDRSNASRRLYAATFAAGQVVMPAATRRDALTTVQRRLQDRLVAVAARTGTTVVDPRDTMCSGALCQATIGGRTIYADNNHIRATRIHLPQFGFLDAGLGL
jgi:peptidoglycan/LPS O-acetylase OafA/YrhL